MKKILVISLFLLLVASQAWGTRATVTETEYGYEITGGTDATYIANDTWTTATAYTVGQKVVVSNIIYACQVAHTSGSFPTDLAAADWVVQSYATIWIKSITQKAASATDTTTLTSGTVGVSGTSGTSAFAILNTSTVSWSGDGKKIAQPVITLAAAGDIIYIDINRKNF
jgi:hypothetical protein